MNSYKENKKVDLGERSIGHGEPVYIIAEGGLTNWGELELAKKQVDAAMAAGCDAIKFQAQTTEELASKKVDPYWYKRLKYKELSYNDLRELWSYCEVRNIQCFITAHTDVDLDFLDKELNVPFIKIGSGESINYDFLRNVGFRKKPVIISFGLHLNDEEILKTIRVLEESGATEIVAMHCNTVYPTPPEINHLGMIKRLQGLLDCPVGYSDHTVGRHMSIAAVAMGACAIEKHLSFDKSDMRSFDCPGSNTPEDLKKMVKEIREVEAAMKEPGEVRIEKIKNARGWAQQSIVAKYNIPEGSIITKEALAFKRPGVGLTPDKAENKIRKTAGRNIEEDELITEADLK